jgi:hypothetical protein
MARAGALRVVAEVSNPPDEPRGDPSKTMEAVAGWREGQRRCRARKRHNWGPYGVWEHRSHYEVVEQCGHCRNRRTADFNKVGHKLTNWRPDYRDGYLLPKGAARIDEDLHDALMLSDILSRKVVEVPNEDED